MKNFVILTCIILIAVLLMAKGNPAESANNYRNWVQFHSYPSEGVRCAIYANGGGLSCWKEVK